MRFSGFFSLLFLGSLCRDYFLQLAGYVGFMKCVLGNSTVSPDMFPYLIDDSWVTHCEKESSV